MVNQFGDVLSDTAGISSGGSSSIVISLIDLDPYVIKTNLTGAFIVTVISDVEGGPGTIFNVTKIDPLVEPQFDNVASSPASDGNAIGFEWPDSGGLQIGKSMVSYNNSYTVTIIG